MQRAFEGFRHSWVHRKSATLALILQHIGQYTDPYLQQSAMPLVG
jgi:hypothetical protein